MAPVGLGAYEIVVDTTDGWFRVIYVARFAEAIYVLHSFQKKTNKAPQHDIDLPKRRYAAVLKEPKQ
jgi:phage-related protein